MKTVGFLGALQPSPETKLAMPCTSQCPSAAWQFRGPPESPWGTGWGGCQCQGGSQRAPPQPGVALTLQPAFSAPPAQIMVRRMARMPHQSGWVQRS